MQIDRATTPRLCFYIAQSVLCLQSHLKNNTRPGVSSQTPPDPAAALSLASRCRRRRFASTLYYGCRKAAKPVKRNINEYIPNPTFSHFFVFFLPVVMTVIQRLPKRWRRLVLETATEHRKDDWVADYFRLPRSQSEHGYLVSSVNTLEFIL